LQCPPVATLRWGAATQSDQPGFRRTVEFSRHGGPGLPIQYGLAFAHELLANPDDLPFGQAHRFRDFPIPTAAVGMVGIGHQQDTCPAHLGCRDRLPPTNRLQFGTIGC
jgi:hypothetical protein